MIRITKYFKGDHMSELIQYFLSGMKNGAVGQVNFDDNNINSDIANISNDFKVVTRRTVGEDRYRNNKSVGVTRNTTKWDAATATT